MSRRVRPAPCLLVAMLCLLPVASGAQTTTGKRLIILPFSAPVADSMLAHQVHLAFVGGLRTLPGISVASDDDTRRLLGFQEVPTIIARVDRLHEFALRSGASLVVAGLVNQEPTGAVEITVLIYSREERRVRDLLEQRYDSIPKALAEAGELGRSLTHPRNLSPSDTPFIYSMLMPGTGQLILGAPCRALLSAGLVTGALIYGLTTPGPDPFRLDFRHYNTYFHYDSNSYVYYYHQEAVSAETFFEALNDDRARHLAAEGQRRAVEVRRRRAVMFFLGAYLYNLADTILLTRRQVDASRFFWHLESIIDDPSPNRRSIVLGLHLSWRLP